MQLYSLLSTVSITLFLLSPPSEGTLWALLVAGSNGYAYYRHQADICHAYQILKNNGVPAENIITMMYDDIAFDSQNPTQGVIINKPGGEDVYAGVGKDYTGETITSQNFINVLSGNEEAMKSVGTGRVINSGSNDTIFLNFVGLGGPGIIAFPNGEELTAKDLIESLNNMWEKEKFKNLIVYVESSYSGSMFESILPDNTSIFVMTASDPNENSYACYFDGDRGVFLGDVFSVNWMEWIDKSKKEDLTGHSLHHLFEIVRTDTRSFSHVEEYGDLDIGSMNISEVLGFPSSDKSKAVSNPGRKNELKNAVDFNQAPLEILYTKIRKLKQTKESDKVKLVGDEIVTILKNRQLVYNITDQLILQMTNKNITYSNQLRNKNVSINKKNINCYDAAVKEFSKTCFKISKNPFVMTQLHVLLNTCSLFSNGLGQRKIIQDIHHVCEKFHLQQIMNIV